MMALAAVAFTSCEADDDPKLNEPTEFVLNTPPFATQLYDLTPDGVIELTCSQPNYGLTLATTYGVEISMREDFGENLPAPGEEEAPYSVTILPTNPQSAVLQLQESKIAEAICAMRGITSEEEYTEIPAHPLYIRALAHINNQPATKITSNVVTLTQVKGYCAFEAEVFDVLYTPGNSNGWDQNASQQILAYAEGKYRGFVWINGEFKFTNQPDWGGTNYGSGGDGLLDTDGGAGNINMPDTGEGLYFADVDINALTYKLTYISSVGIAGDVNGWSESAPLELEPSADFLTWTYTGDFVDGGFKFVFNKAWTINLGGTFESLELDGANLNSTSGSHTVTLDLTKLPYTASFE